MTHNKTRTHAIDRPVKFCIIYSTRNRVYMPSQSISLIIHTTTSQTEREYGAESDYEF